MTPDQSIRMTENLVSIAMATFNGRKYIEEQLESLIAQTYKNTEIIISDDFSEDGTWEILTSYAKKDERIKLLPRTERLGYVHNFIRAFKSCKGEFISPCDQDDIWHANKTELLVNAIGRDTLIYCDNVFIDEDGKSLNTRFSDSRKMLFGSDSRSLLFCTSICGHAMLFRSDLLEHIDSFDIAPYVDWTISFLAMENGRVQYLDIPLVKWRQHSSSVTSHVRRPSQAARRKMIETDAKTIQAFSMISKKNREFAHLANRHFEKWRESYFHPSLFLFVLRHGHITHIAHPAKFPSLKYFFGLKLKRFLRPNFY